MGGEPPSPCRQIRSWGTANHVLAALVRRQDDSSGGSGIIPQRATLHSLEQDNMNISVATTIWRLCGVQSNLADTPVDSVDLKTALHVSDH